MSEQVRLARIPDGKTYAWQLQALNRSPLGVGLFASEFWARKWVGSHGLTLVESTTTEAAPAAGRRER